MKRSLWVIVLYGPEEDDFTWVDALYGNIEEALEAVAAECEPGQHAQIVEVLLAPRSPSLDATAVPELMSVDGDPFEPSGDPTPADYEAALAAAREFEEE